MFRYHAMAVLPHEIADTLATLTNFDVASDDPVHIQHSLARLAKILHNLHTFPILLQS
jgi:hypothetical protein